MDAVRHVNINPNITFDSMDMADKAGDNVDNLEMYADT